MKDEELHGGIDIDAAQQHKHQISLADDADGFAGAPDDNASAVVGNDSLGTIK